MFVLLSRIICLIFDSIMINNLIIFIHNNPFILFEISLHKLINAKGTLCYI